MAVLDHLEPKSVFHFFEEICAIPHGSGNTGQISAWLMAFAKERNLESYQDSMNNVVIIKEASPGYEASEPVILQGHMDMVCEKAPGCTKNMEKEGLDLVVEGDTVYARDTTLGGDDGIAAAIALALLDADDIPHPRLEVILTVDEEIGLLGADGIELPMIKGRRMLNLDSEDEGIFTVSCAGGNTTLCTLPVEREPFPGASLTITAGGLQGGHSGVEIDKGRGNACMLLGRVLNACSNRASFRIVCVNGGQKDNAIPREASAVIIPADPKSVDRIAAVCAELHDALRDEFCLTDPDVFVSVRESDPAGTDRDGSAPDGAGLPDPMTADSTKRLITFLTCVPNGIYAMSAGVEGLVQTSLNLGILVTKEEAVNASFCVRSSIDSQKFMLIEKIDCLTTMLGGSISTSGTYTGWAYRADSPLRDLMIEVFTKQYGHAPRVEAIHAGLECGIFAGKLPGLDCVSLGPDLTEVHTCREKLHIASVQRLWKMLLELLKQMK